LQVARKLAFSQAMSSGALIFHRLPSLDWSQPKYLVIGIASGRSKPTAFFNPLL
jgi:hypothetical protein